MLEIPNKEEFTKLCEDRVQSKDLAKKYFVSATTIQRWVKFYGLNKRGYKFKKEVLEELISTSLTKNAIAEKLGCSTNTLNTYLNKYGLQRVAK